MLLKKCFLPGMYMSSTCEVPNTKHASKNMHLSHFAHAFQNMFKVLLLKNLEAIFQITLKID